VEEVEEPVKLHLILDILHAGEEAIVAGAFLVLEIVRFRGHDANPAAAGEPFDNLSFLNLERDSESVRLSDEGVLQTAEHYREVAEEDVAAAENHAGIEAHFFFWW